MSTSVADKLGAAFLLHMIKALYGSVRNPDTRDVCLHAGFLTGLNLVLRDGKISELRLENVTVDDNIIQISLPSSIKRYNDTEG